MPKARREAHRLWAAASRSDAGSTYLARGEPAALDVGRRFEELVARRLRGEPMAYVVGETGFRHLTLTVDRRALIPRPETEGVIDHALTLQRDGRAADLGTGTGCLALALRQEGAFTVVVATDLSAEALALASENREKTGHRIELARGDLASPLRQASFDLIVANPPYVTEAEHAELDRSVKDWEPVLALTSAENGMALSRRILAEVPAVLRAGGSLVMELDSTRATAVARTAADAGWEEVQVWNDLFGRPRYLTARRW